MRDTDLDSTGRAIVNAAIDFYVSHAVIHGVYPAQPSEEKLLEIRAIVTSTVAYVVTQAKRKGYEELARLVLANLPDEVTV